MRVETLLSHFRLVNTIKFDFPLRRYATICTKFNVRWRWYRFDPINELHRHLYGPDQSCCPIEIKCSLHSAQNEPWIVWVETLLIPLESETYLVGRQKK